MACPANERDDQGRLEDPITYNPLEEGKYLQVFQLCYDPESLADWILEHNEVVDVYNSTLTERNILDLLHLLTDYPRYSDLVHLVAEHLNIILSYTIYLRNARHPVTMTHYRTFDAAQAQAERQSRMDGKCYRIGVFPLTDDLRFDAPLQHFIEVE